MRLKWRLHVLGGMDQLCLLDVRCVSVQWVAPAVLRESIKELDRGATQKGEDCRAWRAKAEQALLNLADAPSPAADSFRSVNINRQCTTIRRAHSVHRCLSH